MRVAPAARVCRHLLADGSSSFIRQFFLFASAVTFFGCATFAPQDFSKYKEGEWQAKALVRDKKQSRSGIINLKIKALDGRKLRIDATSPVGTHLASVLLQDGELEYLSVQDKTLYKMRADRESLRRLLKVPLDPPVLYNILFDRGIADKNWSCSEDQKGRPQSCVELRTKLRVEWAQREGVKRVIDVEHPDATLQMNLYGFKKQVVDPQNAFQLKVPPSFKAKKM